MKRFLLVLMLLCGCATTGSGELTRELLRFEAATGTTTGWKRVVTPDFELLTDLEPELAQRGALLISQSVDGLSAMFARAPVVVERKLLIVAMRDGLDYERHFGKRAWGLAFTSGAETTLFLYGPPDRWFVRREMNYEGTQSVLQHELSHAVLARYFSEQPRWFAEGMAQYLETYRWLDAQTLQLGDPNLDAYRRYKALRAVDIADMLAWATIADDARIGDSKTDGLYGLSWAFIHYARNQEPKQLAEYLSMLGGGAEPSVAWARSFGDHQDSLGKALHAYMLHGQYQQFVLKMPLGSPATVRLESGQPDIDAQVAARLKRVDEALAPPPSTTK